MSRCVDFYEDNDLREKAISKALEKYNTALEIDEEVPLYIEDKADVIIYEWKVEQEIEETDRLHSQSINNHIKKKINGI